MKPDEALYHLENHGGMGVPRFYTDMPRPMLERLVQECARMSGTERSEAALTAWAQKRLKQTDWRGIAEKKKPGADAEGEDAPSPIAALPEVPLTLVDRAILKPGRLSTPRRRQAAFLSHFARCPSTIEAATRTGVDRTVQRWRKSYPLFDQKCRDIVEARRQQAIENVVLAADHVEVRPVFYRGKKVGAYARRDRALDLHLLKQADAAAVREEKRREAKADFDARVAAEVAKQVAQEVEKQVEKQVEEEVARRISEMSRSPRHRAPPQDDEFTNIATDFDPFGCDIALAP